LTAAESPDPSDAAAAAAAAAAATGRKATHAAAKNVTRKNIDNSHPRLASNEVAGKPGDCTRLIARCRPQA
jgi:hypothetical protein